MASISTINPNKRWASGPNYGPAYNAGHVRVQCKVNDQCPFTDAPAHESSIIFNMQSISSFPKDNTKLFGVVPGLEGLFLQPVYNYRHMFVGEYSDNDSVTLLGNNTFFGTDPIYKEDYTWIISDSFFQDTDLFSISKYDQVKDIIGNDPCFDQPVWAYTTENRKHVQSNDGVDPLIGSLQPYTDSMVQSLRQMTAAKCKGKGVHWKLTKKTTMKKGQDFFLEFFPKAISDDVAFIKLENDTFQGSSSTKYNSIDVRAGSRRVSFSLNGTTFKDAYYVNNAVKGEKEKFDLTKQAYYCIEMGDGTNRHYMVMLPQNGNPTFIEIVHIDNRWFNTVSFVHSVLDGISCDKIMKADSFRMTFRNHLGRLVIYFDVGGEVIPWVIQRKRPVVNSDNIENPSNPDVRAIDWEDDITVVPQGKLSVFGGNMVTSFCFGYLQYINGQTFQYPFKESFSIPLGCKNKRVLLSVANGDEESNLYNCDSDKVVEGDSEKFITFLKTGRPLRYVCEDQPSILECQYVALEDDELHDVQNYKIHFAMTPGTYNMNGWNLTNGKTPILTVARILGDQGIHDLWNTSDENILSDSIMSFSETWNSESLTKISHEGTLTFLFFEEMEEYNILKHLYNKAFYVQIEVSYGIAPNETIDKSLVGHAGSVGSLESEVPYPVSGCNYTLLNPNYYYRLMTGICYGGDISYEHGKKVLVCKIYDYSKILEHKIFLNSPYYDGYNDAQSLNSIFSMASFKYGANEPGYLLNTISSRFNTQNIANNYRGNNFISLIDNTGRRSTYKEYYLPDSYDKLQNPFFKFKDGENYWQGINKICETSGQVGFFDEYGVFHYEKDPSELYRNSAFADRVGSRNISTVDGALNPQPIFKYTWDPGLYDGQMIFNKLDTSYGVIDVYNTFKVVSSSPEGALLMSDRVNIDMIKDPNRVGFLGYERLWWQVLPLGNRAATERLADFNSSFFVNPPRVWKFETQGLPVRPKDIIEVNGEVFSVVNVNNNIDAAKNLWWQNIECEWYEITPPIED